MIKRDLYTKNDIKYIKGIDLGEDLIACVELLYEARRVCGLSKAYVYYFNREASLTKQNIFSQIDNINKFTAEIQSYFDSKGSLSIYMSSLSERRYRLKFWMLINSSLEEQRRIVERLKIDNFDEWKYKYKGFGIHWKIGMYCANRGHIWAFNIIRSLCQLIKGR